MNQIPVFSQNGRDVSLSIAEQCSALLTRLFVVAPAFAKLPPPPRPWRASRRGEPDAETQKCLCKHMISRRLGPFSTFFAPFLSHKGLISRRLRRKRGLFESDAEFHEHKLTQSRRVAESQSRRSQHPILRKCSSWIGSVPSDARREAVDSRIKRSKVGLGGSLSGIKWDKNRPLPA
jgi:hypothetical protein